MTKAVRVTRITRAAACVCAACVLMGAGVAQARVSAHLEGGLGQSVARPLSARTEYGALTSAGLSLPLRGPVRTGLELTASIGDAPPWISTTGVSPTPGERSLVTLLASVEWMPKIGRGPFLMTGFGAGHSTLSAARRSFLLHWPDEVDVPPRNRIAFAYGVGAGYRATSGPWALGWQVALRHHATVHAGQVDASTTAMTLGLVY